MKGFAERNMAGALAGLKVVEWAAFRAGVSTGYMLGDMGARVIKIEAPGKMDPSACVAGLVEDTPTLAGGRSFPLEVGNRNKRSITVDIDNPQGREIVYKLVKDADVFITNHRSNALKSANMDYEALKKVNPRIIYARTTALGSRGPEGDKRGYDAIGGARSGLMWAVGDRDHTEPFRIAGNIFDQMAAIELSFGILAALEYRDRTGHGQEVEVSLMGSAIHLQSTMTALRIITGRTVARHSRKRARNVMSNHYRCKDGRWIIFTEPQSDRFWNKFCTVIGKPELISDPRFGTSLKRRDSYAQLIPLLDEAFAAKDRAEWLRLFDEHKCEFAYSQVNDFDDLMTDPQALANGYIVDFDHPALGKVKVPGFPIRFSEAPCAIQRESPKPGQHTDEVLAEQGYGKQDIVRLREQHVV